jgi:starch-binding outer membrane protein SusE/F
MKKSIISLLAIFGLLIFTSCEDTAGPVMEGAPEAPEIIEPGSGASFVLNQEDPEAVLDMVEWSAAEYGFSAAIEYTIEIDLESSFDNPVELATVRENSYSPSVGELNNRLLAAGLTGSVENTVYLRVKADISDDVNSVHSNPIEVIITPYQDSFPPIYMIGAAVGGWDPGLAVIVPSDEPNVYTTLAKFTSGEAFRFFGQQDWGPDSWNYPYFADNGGDIDELFVDAEDGDNNFQFTGTTGWYRITVNMDTYSVQLEEADEPIMYMTGLAVGGWDTPGTGESVKMNFIQEGVFEATTDFSSEGDGNFRFFGQADWGPDSYNYPYFVDNDGDIDPLLIDAGDGDNNFEFTGDDGSYYIKVDINNYTVEMEAQ